MQNNHSDIHAQPILIVDFGSQYTQLIARRVRECGVYCEIHPFDIDPHHIAEFQPAGVILSGGPESVTEGQTPRIADEIFALGVPVLGICYGMQAMAAQLGGVVSASSKREFGHAQVSIAAPSALLNVLGDGGGSANVWMSHGDKVSELPAGFICTGSSGSAPIAAMENVDKRFYGVQFHPEVTHTDGGDRLLLTFTKEICGCAADWTAATDMFASDPLISRIFDPILIGNLVRCKRQEMEKFEQMPTSTHWRALLERV